MRDLFDDLNVIPGVSGNIGGIVRDVLDRPIGRPDPYAFDPGPGLPPVIAPVQGTFVRDVMGEPVGQVNAIGGISPLPYKPFGG